MPSIFVKILFYLMPFASFIMCYFAHYCSNLFDAIATFLILSVITFIFYSKLVSFCKVTYESVPLYLGCYSIKWDIVLSGLFNFLGMMGYDFYCIKRENRQYLVISKRYLVNCPQMELRVIKLNEHLLLEV